MKITQGWIEKATEESVGGKLIWDDQVPFLGVRIGQRKKVWLVRVRDQNRDTKIILGDALSIHPPEARMMALKEVDLRKGKPTLRFADWSARWMATHPMGYRTKRDYTRHMKILVGYLGRKSLREITRVEIGFVRDESTKLHGNVQANRILACLSSCLGDALEVDALDFNPCIGVRRNQTQSRERRLNLVDLRKVLAAIQEEPNICHRNYYLALMFTGCRPGEARCMRWEDVNLEAREWLLKTTKNKRSHLVPLSDTLVKILREMPQTNDWVFPGRTDKKPMHESAHIQTWRKLTAKAGMADLHMHDLRRTAASLLLDEGKDLKFIGALLNHESQATTEIYARAGAPGKREAVAILERVLNDLAPQPETIAQGH